MHGQKAIFLFLNGKIDKFIVCCRNVFKKKIVLFFKLQNCSCSIVGGGAVIQ